MKKLYILITALLIAAAPKTMAITVDDLVGEYSTKTDGSTKLTAGGIQGTTQSFDTTKPSPLLISPTAMLTLLLLLTWKTRHSLSQARLSPSPV